MTGTVDLTYLIIIALLGLSSLLLLYFHYEKSEEVRKLQKIVDSYSERYLKRQGGTRMYKEDEMLNYNLMSVDGGQIWYAFEYGKNWEVRILGEVEKVYPGLMAHLDAWDNFKNYVEIHGAIDPDNISPELQKILDKAKIKFEVK